MNDIAYDYAMSHLGVWYKWGGNNRLEGLDCGGFVSEVLRSQGLVHPYRDLNTGGLWDAFGKLPEAPVSRGALLFLRPAKGKTITHVALALSETTMIESGGGGQGFDTISRAAAGMGAMVRVRPISHPERDLVIVRAVMPPWPK